MTQFSETLMDHFQSPQNQGRMESPDYIGTAGVPGQGRYIQLFLRVSSGRVERMQFESYGCGVTIAVSSVLTELVAGQTRVECAKFGVPEIVAALDGIPPHKLDAAYFGVTALRAALQEWSESDSALSQEVMARRFSMTCRQVARSCAGCNAESPKG